MSSEPVDYEVVLADLESRRAAFNAAIDAAMASIRQILALTSGIGHMVGPATNVAAKAEPDSFFGLGLTDAAKKYLRSVRQRQSNKEIAEGLERAGYMHTSKNFTNTIGTALWRAELDGDQELYRQGRYWLLTEWLPGGRKPARLKNSTETPGAADAAADQEPEPDVPFANIDPSDE